LIGAWHFGPLWDVSLLALIAAAFLTAGAYLFSKIEV
jgi:ABC-2 type transport system permease protein